MHLSTLTELGTVSNIVEKKRREHNPESAGCEGVKAWVTPRPSSRRMITFPRSRVLTNSRREEPPAKASAAVDQCQTPSASRQLRHRVNEFGEKFCEEKRTEMVLRAELALKFEPL